MVIAGSTRCATVPEPETGSNPSLIAKKRIKMGPRAKLGKDNPKRLTTLSSRSSQRLGRCAEHTPAGTESVTATSNDASVNSNVYGYRCAIMLLTLWLKRNDGPRS